MDSLSSELGSEVHIYTLIAGGTWGYLPQKSAFRYDNVEKNI